MSAQIGQPPMYSDPKEMQSLIDEYFTLFGPETTLEQRTGRGIACYENRPTITGLCLFLGFETRQSFYDYEKKESFAYTIKKARSRIENVYENMIGTKTGTIGGIFALKNMNWSDKQEIDHTTGGEKLTPSAINLTIDGENIKLK